MGSILIPIVNRGEEVGEEALRMRNEKRVHKKCSWFAEECSAWEKNVQNTDPGTAAAVTCLRNACRILCWLLSKDSSACWNAFPRCSTVTCLRYFQSDRVVGFRLRQGSSVCSSNSYSRRTNGSLPNGREIGKFWHKNPILPVPNHSYIIYCVELPF